DSLETMERLGAECVALSTRLGDSTALNYTYWNIASDYAFRGLMREARVWALKLLDAGRERNDRRALGIAHAIFAMVDVLTANFHEAARHAEECVRTAVTPFDRPMGAISKASAEIFLGDVQGGNRPLARSDGRGIRGGLGPDGCLRNRFRRRWPHT